MLRTPAPLSRPRTMLVTGVFGIAIVAGAWMFRHGTAGAETPANGAQLFDQVRTYLAETYIDTLSDAQLYRMAVDGLVTELGDPYNAFLPPDRLRRLSERTSGNYAGIGLQVDLRDGFVVVVSPVPGGPADRAGIMTGDRITEIDGRTVHGWTRDEVERLLRGPAGSAVHVTIMRASGDSLKLTLSRAPIHQSAVWYTTLLPGSVGYVELKTFTDSTVTELARTVDSLVARGAQSLVIDLRASPGGYLEQGVRAADLFLDRGETIVSTRGRVAGANQTYVDKAAQRWPKLRLAVLVDETTASAAELFAGALQDHDRAVIVGLSTYGKGSAQNVYPIDSAGALKLTTARWFTPSGRSISRLPQTDDDDGADGGGSGPGGAKKKERPKFKTDAGRTVLGGGGIAPDLEVGDTATSPENLALLHAVGSKAGQFRDALTSYALAAKAAGTVKAPNFAVTPAMLGDVYARMVARGVDVPRATYDAASAVVARLLSYEIARYVFGADAYFRRKVADDRAINAAQRLLAGAVTQDDALRRAEVAADAAKKSTGVASAAAAPND